MKTLNNVTRRNVELTEPERRLLSQIEFTPSREKHDPEAARANGEMALELTKLLLQRKGIPQVRLTWFTDPSYNIGGHGSSRRDVFVKNGMYGEDIFRHPHFLKYLNYFVFGPELPSEVIAGFEGAVAYCGIVTSGDIIPLGEHAKQQARAHRLEAIKAAEEFYKLALECGLDSTDARMIRDAVKKLRSAQAPRQQ
jgi:hypothetical protein